MDKFYEQLEKYKPYEVEASKRITKLNNTKLLRFCNNFKYDFITYPDKLKFEVKTDVKSLTTNNFFIEFSGYGKLSGISTTKSNYYILSDTINYYLIETKKIKELIENYTFKIIPTADKLTYGYIIPKNIITLHSIAI